MKSKGIKKAVPGGKYGCSLMLKQLYSKEFGDVSLGKIIALIKKSLQVQEFLHFKTLIMKNKTLNKMDLIKKQNQI